MKYMIFFIGVLFTATTNANNNSMSIYNCVSKSGRTNLVVKLEDEESSKPRTSLVTLGIDGHFVNYTSNPKDLEVGHLYDLVSIDYDKPSESIFVTEGRQGVLVALQMNKKKETAIIEKGFFDPRRFARPRSIGPIKLNCKRFVMHFE